MTKEDELLINRYNEQLQNQTEADLGVAGQELNELEKKIGASSNRRGRRS